MQRGVREHRIEFAIEGEALAGNDPRVEAARTRRGNHVLRGIHRDDAVYFMMNRFSPLRPYTPPADVFDIFRREFEAAYEEHGLFQLTMHPHVIGYRSRIWIIEELIRLAQSRPGVWFATHADVARWAKENAG